MVGWRTAQLRERRLPDPVAVPRQRQNPGCSASCGRRRPHRRLTVRSARRSSPSALGPAQRSRPCTRPSGSTRRSTSARARPPSPEVQDGQHDTATATSTAAARTTASRSTASPRQGPGTRLPDVHERLRPVVHRQPAQARLYVVERIPRPGSVRTRPDPAPRAAVRQCVLTAPGVQPGRVARRHRRRDQQLRQHQQQLVLRSSTARTTELLRPGAEDRLDVPATRDIPASSTSLSCRTSRARDTGAGDTIPVSTSPPSTSPTGPAGATANDPCPARNNDTSWRPPHHAGLQGGSPGFFVRTR